MHVGSNPLMGGLLQYLLFVHLVYFNPLQFIMESSVNKKTSRQFINSVMKYPYFSVTKFDSILPKGP